MGSGRRERAGCMNVPFGLIEHNEFRMGHFLLGFYTFFLLEIRLQGSEWNWIRGLSALLDERMSWGSPIRDLIMDNSTRY